MRKGRWVTLILALTCLHCGGAQRETGAHVVDADAAGVEGCKPLGDFAGAASANQARRSNGWDERDGIRRDAAAHGATHIVWSTSSTERGTVITAAAYTCP